MLGVEKAQVFKDPNYVINESTTQNNSVFFRAITKYRKYEENNTISNLKKLISEESNLESRKKSSRHHRN